MAFEGQQGIVAVHAMAIVADADQPASASLNFDANVAGVGIQSVLQEFFYDRGRPVYHLAGGDLIGNLVGKYADAAHSSLGYRRSGVKVEG